MFSNKSNGVFIVFKIELNVDVVGMLLFCVFVVCNILFLYIFLIECFMINLFLL